MTVYIHRRDYKTDTTYTIKGELLGRVNMLIEVHHEEEDEMVEDNWTHKRLEDVINIGNISEELKIKVIDMLVNNNSAISKSEYDVG